jgi:hypothetical protein
MEKKHLQILDNIQVVHECRDSRNDHMQTRARKRSKGNNIEEIDMTEVPEHLDDIDRMLSRKVEEPIGTLRNVLTG